MYWGQFEASHDLFEPCFQLMKTMVGSNLKEEQLRQVVNRTVLFVDKVTLSLLDVDVDLFANRVAKAADNSFYVNLLTNETPWEAWVLPF